MVHAAVNRRPSFATGRAMTAASSFGLDVGTAGRRAVLSLRGKVDAATDPDLARLAGAFLESGTEQLVVDLDDVKFMDGAALVAIANMAHVLGSAPGGAGRRPRHCLHRQAIPLAWKAR